MRTSRRNDSGFAAIGVIGAIVIAFTVGAFFLMNVERTALNVWALSFLLLSEVVLFAGMICLRYTRSAAVFVRSGAVVVLWMYFFVTLATVLFARAFADHLNGFVLLQLGIVALFAISMVAIVAIGRRLGAHDGRIVDARRFMDGCESRIHALLVDGRNARHEKLLNGLHEGLKYADKIGASSLDAGIDGKISELETALNARETDDNSEAAVVAVAGEITALIGRRKAEIGQAKRGGF